MRIMTLNVNGLRSAHKKGFFDWMRRAAPDVVCLQEVRASLEDLPRRAAAPRGFSAYYNCGEKKGYSGVAILSRRPADRIVSGLGSREFDPEGRYLQADFGPLSIVSLYLPSGSSGDKRQAAKMRFLRLFRSHLRKLLADGRHYVLCGDFNIAHQKIDLENWRGNQDHSGFLPEERAWLDKVYRQLGYVDAFRRVCDRPREYTWWSNRGQAWAKNVGWRIDLQIVTPGLGSRVQGASIYRRRRFSDHAPLIVDYDWPTTELSAMMPP